MVDTTVLAILRAEYVDIRDALRDAELRLDGAIATIDALVPR